MLTKKQLEDRVNSIGASEAPAIMGLCPYGRTPLTIWLEKVGITEPQQLEFGSPMYWGIKLEPVVAEAYSEFMGVKVRKSLITMFHVKHDFITCHLDRKIKGEHKILECKTSHAYARDEWGESGTTHAPLGYIVQVQHQMAVTEYGEADIAVLIGGNELRYYPIKRDEQIISRVIEEEKIFWNDYVLPRIAPPCVNKSDVKLLYRQDTGEAIDATDEIAESIDRLAQLKEAAKVNEKEKDSLEDRIALFMKGASIIQYYGKQLATWKADKNGRRSFRIKSVRGE